MKIFNTFSRSLALIIAMCNLALGWGKTGHQIINGSFESHLPQPLQFISAKSAYYVAHASDADNRKSSGPGESPKHFIDIDYYPEFAAGTLQHNYDSLCTRYGAATVVDNGTLPWAITSAYDNLVAFMENKDWDNADWVIADLGHYIGDAYQPLHCTQNYDGAMTNNKGIHSRFETGLLDRYRGNIMMSAGTATRRDTSVIEYAFRVIGRSNSRVSAILDADTYAKGIDPKYGSAYYDALWSKVDAIMNEQLNGAAESLASLVYSAWLDAGSPTVAGVNAPSVPSGYLVSDIYPNPFNPVASIEVNAPLNSPPGVVRVSVYSPDGKLIRNETQNLLPGRNLVKLDLTRYASGVYLVVVRQGNPVGTNVRMLKAVMLK